jgi:hemoglobin
MTEAATTEKVRPQTPYERLGGADVVSALVERFYDLIEGDPDYAAVRATHGADMSRIRTALTGFLTGWLGGPRDYFTNGGPCMVSLHAKLPISEDAAQQWGAAMTRAIFEQPRIDSEIGPALSAALSDMARSMINRRPD